ncbi:MAG TPA: hypothetical protein VKR82_00180 [Candidatus Acidoferrales bacterium]|nr:hypothetical protein [Candidatus Acidoferrales bacterium]
MNKFTKLSLLGAIAAMTLFAVGAVHAQKKTVAASHVGPSASEEYFMVSSVDKAHSALIVLRPTQITATLLVNDKTQFADENGKPLKLSDYRTGDTIFASFTTQAGGVLTATHVRKGMMTMAEMRKRYLPGLPITTSPPGLGH